eukprot:gnl/TRDRNA2_/TRDRNA2_63212_c0_seq2.p1 gnl/TRDRNA2_/TRDRNA2_63212_c0~~gnl/TRDRNA2_/TRDRNA2_63212_c0_seq2.p1  ORF type:complete len:115 (-),score=3.43 gnl/TRDRNA2_/TRDRNA2_63212_c0_seq2:90-434(-)
MSKVMKSRSTLGLQYQSSLRIPDHEADIIYNCRTFNISSFLFASGCLEMPVGNSSSIQLTIMQLAAVAPGGGNASSLAVMPGGGNASKMHVQACSRGPQATAEQNNPANPPLAP